MTFNLCKARPERRTILWSYILLTIFAIGLGPALACGSFAPRPTPTWTPAPFAQPQANELPTPIPTPTRLPPAPTATLVPVPTPTFTLTPVPGSELTVGQPARVSAPNGLNMRGEARSTSNLVLQLGTGQRVNVVNGPVSNGGFTWWQVEDAQGNRGWVADGDDETVWLSPQVGEPQPVGRPPRIGDRVRVTMDSGLQLTIRALPGTDGPLIKRVNPGQEFTVINGPQIANGFSWYQIRADNGTLEGWAADGDGTSRWLSPLE